MTEPTAPTTAPLLNLVHLAVRLEMIEDADSPITPARLDAAWNAAVSVASDAQVIECAEQQGEHNLDVWLDARSTATGSERWTAMSGMAAELRSSLDSQLETWARELAAEAAEADRAGESNWLALCDLVQADADAAGL